MSSGKSDLMQLLFIMQLYSSMSTKIIKESVCQQKLFSIALLNLYTVIAQDTFPMIRSSVNILIF